MAVRQSGSVALVELGGRLTSFESIRGASNKIPALYSRGDAQREMVHGLLKQGQRNIVLNLTRLDYLDSSGIGELARIYVATVKQGGAMRVVGLASRVEEILKITQLYQVFPEFPDEASALESFAGQ
jgi:anti-sigma B factor antagonist